MAIPKLLTADQLSDTMLERHGFKITGSRFLELARIDAMPHVRIDNGPPFFRYSESADWIARNLMKEYKGNRLAFRFEMIDPTHWSTRSFAVPSPLAPMAHRLRRLPLGLLNREACIYFLIDNGRIVYVGKTECLAQRILVHFGDKPFDDVLWLPVPEDDAAIVEAGFIRHLRPELNSPTTHQAPAVNPERAESYVARYLANEAN